MDYCERCGGELGTGCLGTGTADCDLNLELAADGVSPDNYANRVPHEVSYTMDTADRYSLEQVKAMLHRQMGRKQGAHVLYHAGMDGECTVGGTKVTRCGSHFTVTDA